MSADFIFSYIFHNSASGSRDTFLLSAYRGVTQGMVSVVVRLVVGVGESVCAKNCKEILVLLVKGYTGAIVFYQTLNTFKITVHVNILYTYIVYRLNLYLI